MSNVYTKLSMTVTGLSPEARAFLLHELHAASETDNDPGVESQYSVGFDALHIFGEEQANPHAVAEALQATLKQFDITLPVAFTFIVDSSNTRWGGHDGGAVVVTQSGQTWLHVQEWMQQQTALLTPKGT